MAAVVSGLIFYNRLAKPKTIVPQTSENQSIYRSAAHPQLPYETHPSTVLGPNGSGAFYHTPNTPSSLNSAHPTTPSSADFLVSASSTAKLLCRSGIIITMGRRKQPYPQQPMRGLEATQAVGRMTTTLKACTDRMVQRQPSRR